MTQAAGETPEAPALHRLHPLTPLLRGWKVFAALAAYASTQAAEGWAGGGDQTVAGAAGVLGVALLAGAAYGLLSWQFTRYGVVAGDLRIETGVIFRKSRRVRLDRLQAVDVVRPLLARLLGLAELRLEVAGGSSTEAPLAYLSEEHAQRLRAELLARAAGLAEDTPEAPERQLYVVPDGRLLAATVLQLPVVVSGVVAVGVAVASVAAGTPAPAFVLIPTVGSFAVSVAREFGGNQGFTLAESPDGLRIRRGLLETRAQTVPPGRIHAVRIAEPLLWRRVMGWARLEVVVGGYSPSRREGGQASAVLLPVATRQECLDLVARVLPGADLAAIPTRGVPARVRWLDPWGRRVLAAGADDRYFVTRRGALGRKTDVMPHERIQSVRAHQGPLQRLLRLASVTLDTLPGAVTVTARHRDAGEALRIVERQAALAHTARARAVPDQWLLGPGPVGE